MKDKKLKGRKEKDKSNGCVYKPVSRLWIFGYVIYVWRKEDRIIKKKNNLKTESEREKGGEKMKKKENVGLKETGETESIEWERKKKKDIYTEREREMIKA